MICTASTPFGTACRIIAPAMAQNANPIVLEIAAATKMMAATTIHGGMVTMAHEGEKASFKAIRHRRLQRQSAPQALPGRPREGGGAAGRLTRT
jgi:hypothetical protein